MAFAYCPDCGTRIYLGRKPWLGQPVFCETCDADLEIVQLNPPRLDWVDELVDEEEPEEEELRYSWAGARARMRALRAGNPGRGW